MITFDIDKLNDPIEAYVLSSMPNVLSLAKRCVDMGYSFVWRAGQVPFLVAPGGKRIGLKVIDNVPYLDDVDTMVSGAESSDSDPPRARKENIGVCAPRRRNGGPSGRRRRSGAYQASPGEVESASEGLTESEVGDAGSLSCPDTHT